MTTMAATGEFFFPPKNGSGDTRPVLACGGTENVRAASHFIVLGVSVTLQTALLGPSHQTAIISQGGRRYIDPCTNRI